MIHLTVQQLSASLDGALTGPSLELIVRHLAACHDCRDRQARLAKHDDALRRLLAQDPTNEFLEELTRRSTTLVTAIAHGQPAPVMTTSVPLLHEEDPYAPVEPPPLPARPELGRSGEIAKVAGWGRIGMKPTAPTHAPPSDPEEARRLLEAVGRDTADDFTELSAKGLHDSGTIDGPKFDLPSWIKEQSGQPVPRGDARRQLPRVEVFFEAPDPPTAGPTSAPPGPGVRPAAAPAHPSREAGPPAPRPAPHEAAAASPVPRQHAGYAPPGWSGASAPPPPGAFLAPAGSAAPHAGPQPLPWNAPGGEPAPPGSSPYAQALTGEHSQPWPAVTLASAVSRRRAARGVDRAALLALGSVALLLVIVFALQLAPRTRPGRSTPAGAPVLRERVAREPSSPSGERKTVGEPTAPRAQLPLEQVLPPVIPPDAAPVEAAAKPPRPGSVAATPPAHEPGITSSPRGAPPRSHARTQALAQPPRRATALAHEPTPPPQRTTPPAPAVATPAQAAATPAQDHPAPAQAVPAPPAPATASTPPAQAPADSPAHAEVAAPAAAAAPAADDGADLPLLCGTIEDDAGQPVAGARVSMRDVAVATRTDAHGRFCLSAPFGPHSLFVEASGFTPQRTAVTFSSTSADVHVRIQPAR